MILGFAHPAIVVADLDRARDFLTPAGHRAPDLLTPLWPRSR